MKLKVNDSVHTAKPKQSEGKLVIKNATHTTKPKREGIKIYKASRNVILKMDIRDGVKVNKTKTTTVLKKLD